MKSAHGSWHGRGSALGEPLRVFQLWIALPPSEASTPAASQSIAPQEVEEDGPVRVILGQSGMARSRIRGAPADTNCFHVRLKHGQRWRYVAPGDQERIVEWTSDGRRHQLELTAEIAAEDAQLAEAPGGAGSTT